MHKDSFKRITPVDLENAEAFRSWIRESLPSLYRDKNIDDNHLLIYLDYIKGVVNDNKELDRSTWNKLILKLDSDIKTIIKAE